MNGYVAFYKDKRIDVYAETLCDARDKAAVIFKAKKKQVYQVHVVLAEKGGVQVIHDPAILGG
jgi:superfamily II DNA or RNA helicase